MSEIITLLILNVKNKSIVEKLIEFHKIINDLINIKGKINDEDMNLHLLSLLSRPFEHFKYALPYSDKGTIILDEVHTIVRSKELLMMQ